FAVDRRPKQWVLRRAPRHASSATAHDVLREFRILDAIKDESVAIARPAVACDDPEVFGAPFYVMERIDGRPILQAVPESWAAAPESHGKALEELIDALVAIHAVDLQSRGLGDMAHAGSYLTRQRTRWLTQLDSYRRPPPAGSPTGWKRADLPINPARCAMATTSSTICCSPSTRPRGSSPSWTGRWLRSAIRWLIWHGRSSSIPGPRAPSLWGWRRSRGSTSPISPIAPASSSATPPDRVGRRRRSVGTTCSSDGSWPSF